jgi:hypothetical protein
MKPILCFISLLMISPSMTTDADSAFDHSLYDSILKKYVKGDRVDYKSLKSDKDFPSYLEALSKTNPNQFASREEKIAFWINAYNAFTLKLIIDNYPLKSITNLSALGKLTAFVGNSPWKREFFSVNGKKMSLDEIENEILRGKFKEHRVHFAANCASISCPPLRGEAYTAEKLNAQLDEQAKLFFNDASRNRYDFEKKTLYLSSILKWYKDDFIKASGSIEKYIAQYVDAEKKSALQSNQFNIEHLDYDWNLNDAK